MATMDKLILLYIILQLVNNLRGEEPYQVRPLYHNPGLYFEKVDQMRLISKKWRLMLTVDLGSLLGRPLPGRDELYKVYQHCSEKKTVLNCRQQLSLTAIDDLHQELQRNQQHLRHILETTSNTSSGSRHPRAPLLGFIGTISRKLFGTMDYNDQEHIKKEIDRLYQDQNQITRLISNSTHIMQAEINSMKESHDQNTRFIHRAEKKIWDIANRTNELRANTGTLEYLNQLKNIATEAEYAARKYIETSHQVIQAVEDAKHGKLHPSLININQIITAAEEIEKAQPTEVFPLSKNNLDHALLSQASDITTAHHDSKYLVIIEIPLLTKTAMDIYRVIPCKTLQQVQGNQRLAAYITPKEEYLAYSPYLQQYQQFSKQHLQTCIPLENCLACPRGQPMRKAKARPSCEYQLLSSQDQNTTDKYPNCNVKLTNDLSTQWTRIESTEGWLYRP